MGETCSCSGDDRIRDGPRSVRWLRRQAGRWEQLLLQGEEARTRVGVETEVVPRPGASGVRQRRAGCSLEDGLQRAVRQGVGLPWGKVYLPGQWQRAAAATPAARVMVGCQQKSGVEEGAWPRWVRCPPRAWSRASGRGHPPSSHPGEDL